MFPRLTVQKTGCEWCQKEQGLIPLLWCIKLLLHRYGLSHFRYARLLRSDAQAHSPYSHIYLNHTNFLAYCPCNFLLGPQPTPEYLKPYLNKTLQTLSRLVFYYSNLNKDILEYQRKTNRLAIICIEESESIRTLDQGKEWMRSSVFEHKVST